VEAAASRAKKWGRDWYNAHVSFDQPRTPIVIDRVLPDPSVVRGLLIRGAPYWTVQRYVKNLSEMASLSDAGKRGRRDRPMFIAPWFRGDWAYDEPLVEGAEVFLRHDAFRNAAQAMFEGGVVVPQIVYVNLNPPIAQVDPGHVDIPAFRGIDRTRYPVWLLATMLKSGPGDDAEVRAIRPLVRAERHGSRLVLRGRRRRLHLLAERSRPSPDQPPVHQQLGRGRRQ
jgi:hypothetical protein